MSERIADVRAWEALDSRGRPTVACRVTLTGGASAQALAPAGASKGSGEAAERRDGGTRWAGAGVRRAAAGLNEVVAPAVRGLELEGDNHGACTALDGCLEELDGTANLERLGANATVALSIAAVRALAAAQHRELYELLADGAACRLPLPMINIISGGAHTGGARSIDIQDVLVVPVGAASFAEALEWAGRVRRCAAELASRAGSPAGLVADEGGIAAPEGANADAVALVAAAIEACGLAPGDQMAIAVDVAATQFHQTDGRYHLAAEARAVTADAWVAELDNWRRRWPVVSFEDVLAETAWADWTAAAARLGDRQLVGDDLLVTDAGRVSRAATLGAANAVLVKVNQAGTLSRARAAFDAARARGMATVVSARSGETEEAWLADLAVGWDAGQIKVGSLIRSERTAKWNRLLELEATRGLPFAGRSVLASSASPRPTSTPTPTAPGPSGGRP